MVIKMTKKMSDTLTLNGNGLTAFANEVIVSDVLRDLSKFDSDMFSSHGPSFQPQY